MNITLDEIEKDLINYLKKGNPLVKKLNVIPKDKSLVELGYLDSFAIIDLVTYFENKWKIKIDNDEITPEFFGSIDKMTKMLNKKILKK